MSFYGVNPAEFEKHVTRVPGDHWHWTGTRAPKSGKPFFLVGRHRFRAWRVAWGLYRTESAAHYSLKRTCADPECISPFHWVTTDLGRHTVGSMNGRAKLT